MKNVDVINALIVCPSGILPQGLTSRFGDILPRRLTTIVYFDPSQVIDTIIGRVPSNRYRCYGVCYGAKNTIYDAVIVTEDSWKTIPESLADITWVVTKNGLPGGVRLPYGMKVLTYS